MFEVGDIIRVKNDINKLREVIELGKNQQIRVRDKEDGQVWWTMPDNYVLSSKMISIDEKDYEEFKKWKEEIERKNVIESIIKQHNNSYSIWNKLSTKTLNQIMFELEYPLTH